MEASSRAGAAAGLAATSALAAASWVLAREQMQGMDMGVASGLGSFPFFAGAWVSMMAAMMLPGAAAAVSRRARTDPRLRGAPMFLLSYLAVWTLAGGAVYALYRPHSTVLAGIAVIAAGLYELTPLKRRCRRLCRARTGSGLRFGLCCVGSSAGLMLVLLAVGAMSIAWMSALAVVVLVQKLLPERAALDVPLALALLALGVLILAHPASVPGLMPSAAGAPAMHPMQTM
ncbi:MAG: copper chaperone [Solirubrobacteraceae bacterium]